MTRTTVMVGMLALLSGAVLGGVGAVRWRGRQAVAPSPSRSEGQPEDSAQMLTDIAHLKESAPTPSHVMVDVATQFSNLWFAVQAKNWPLATYFFNETRNRIRWVVRINPTPKTPEGVVDVKGIFEGIDAGVLTGLKDAIEKKDAAKFGVMYRQTLESCYACHKAAGRPYLRPMIPTTQPLTIVNFDPAAVWPQ